MVLLEAVQGLKQPLRPGSGDRFRGLLALTLQRLASLAMLRASTLPANGIVRQEEA
jgi:hypothetical protein